MTTQSDLLADLARYTLKDIGCTKTQFQKWLDALRSGQYQQIQGCLHNAKGFCCLGVRADIELVQSGEFQWNENDKIYSLFSSKDGLFSNDGSFLPKELMSRQLQSLLSESNDSGLTFSEIADALESHFMPLFETEKESSDEPTK